MANIITCIRIVLSVALLFCPALSPVFYGFYMAAGSSDLVDGAVARKTGTVSKPGSRLDTIADIVFTAACLIKLLPVLDVPTWLYTWISVIAAIKLLSIAMGYIRQKELVTVHSAINKVFAFEMTHGVWYNHLEKSAFVLIIKEEFLCKNMKPRKSI